MIKLKWFTYDQNNSGGDFVFNPAAGISAKVIVQARDCREANYRAERIGLYFGGSGDCSCCGDRWYELYDTEGFNLPWIYEDCSITEWMSSPYFMKWMGPDRPEVYVHQYDDTFLGFVYGTPGLDLRMTPERDLES